MKNLNLSQKIAAAVVITLATAALILAKLNAAGFTSEQFTNF